MNFFLNSINIFFILCFPSLFIDNFSEAAFNCHLPEKCQLESHYLDFTDNNMKTDKMQEDMICYISDEFKFRFKEPTPQFNTSQKCIIDKNNKTLPPCLIFKWTSTNELSIFEKNFNLTNAMSYLKFFDMYSYVINVKFWDINGFDVNIFDDLLYLKNISYIIKIELTNYRFVFYKNKRKLYS